MSKDQGPMKKMVPLVMSWHQFTMRRTKTAPIMVPLKLATAPLEKVTPQSKFFAIKYHWFRSKLDELGVQILGIRSNDQKADIFTKGLQKSSYQNIRKLLMGW